MKIKNVYITALWACVLFAVSCNNQTTSEEKKTTETSETPDIKEEAVSYKSGTVTHNGFIVYDVNKEGTRPAVLVVPEWWGLNDYVRSRAKQLAEMGYIAMAVDMYGEGKTAPSPQEAQGFATPFYKDPTLTKAGIDAALAKLKEYKQADMGNIAAIGYCFGGYVVLNAAKLGADLKGVASFHGGLAGAQANKDLLKAKILVCHGEADKFESPEEIASFKKGLDSIGADYTFKTYPNATHAFTNPEATEKGKKFNMPIEYNAAADSASWNDMKTFFAKIFNK